MQLKQQGDQCPALELLESDPSSGGQSLQPQEDGAVAMVSTGGAGVESREVAHLLGHRQAQDDTQSSVSCSSRNCLGQLSRQGR